MGVDIPETVRRSGDRINFVHLRDIKGDAVDFVETWHDDGPTDMLAAIDHGGPDVTVEVRELEDGFYVADDGPGIPEENRERVFESAYSTVQDNTGFGLAIVTEIVDAHGWDVTITESASGGAQFTITGVGND